MKTSYRVVVIIFVASLFLSMPIINLPTTVRADPGTAERLYIDPPVVNKAPGDVDSFFDIFITLENFANFAGFDIKLTWDNSLITEESIDYTTYLDALWGTNPDKWSVVYEQHGAGDCELAVTALATSASNPGASVLFKKTFKVVKSCNFPLSTLIHFEVVKLSDNATPTPNPIVPATVTDGIYNMSSTKPDLEIEIAAYAGGHLPPYEYCDYFWVEVYVTHICVNSPLTDYELTIQYGITLTNFKETVEWGVLGTGTWLETTHGEVQVSGAGPGWSGEKGLLFKLKFHAEFANNEEYVWKISHTNYGTLNIEIIDAELSFAQGTIPKTGITIPGPTTIRVDFIRGDVNCDGKVTIIDISDSAYSYNKKSGDPDWATVRRYDLNNDNVIDIYDFVAIATNYGYGVPQH
jgi:hypothetical protein